MPKSKHSWVRSQHPQTQWNLRGGRRSSVKIMYIIRKNPKNPPYNILNINKCELLWAWFLSSSAYPKAGNGSKYERCDKKNE
jgi:hypothetical protein